MDEIPDGPVIHFQPTLSELSDQSAQGEVSLLNSLQEPGSVFARNRFWPVTSDFAGCNTAGLAHALHPVDRGADAYPKLLRRFVA